MSSIFGFYYVVGLLGHMGWPRRRGLLNSEAVFNCLVLDSAIDQMIDWAANIGAHRPDLALRIIATMFRDNDWESEKSFDIMEFVKNSKKSWDEGGNNPRLVVKPFRFSKSNEGINPKKDVISSKDVKDNRIRTALEQYFIESLIWGLVNHGACKIYFETEGKEQKDKLPMYKEAGLDVDSIPTMDSLLKDGEDIIKGYEKEVRPLSPIPKRLQNDALSLGIRID